MWEDFGFRPGIDLGFFTLRYYALAYIAGIVLGYWHLSRMLKSPGAPMAQVHADDLFFYCTLGIIIGGRLGYATFYQPQLWTSIDIFKLWTGGMSFHGGVIGVLVAITWVSWRNGLNWWRVCDYISVNVPLAYMLGRLANFINGELYGRPVDGDFPLAMVFPTDPLQLARHPSQLYQAGFEGLTLGIIMIALFWKTRARYRPGLLVGIFTLGMGAGRFLAEFFREPDAQLKQFAIDTGLSMGQWLSIPLIAAGLAVIAWSLSRPELALGSTRARVQEGDDAGARPA
jgi:phosphatidylglycerol:prolipoprotein diacylglycerol transferase